MRILQIVGLVLTMNMSALAAEPIIGDWSGVIKIGDISLRLALHVTGSPKNLQATFDSVDQKVMAMAVDKIEIRGQELKFEIALIQATYAGTLNKAGTELTGAWSQIGKSFPVNFRKAVPAKK